MTDMLGYTGWDNYVKSKRYENSIPKETLEQIIDRLRYILKPLHDVSYNHEQALITQDKRLKALEEWKDHQIENQITDCLGASEDANARLNKLEEWQRTFHGGEILIDTRKTSLFDLHGYIADINKGSDWKVIDKKVWEEIKRDVNLLDTAYDLTHKLKASIKKAEGDKD